MNLLDFVFRLGVVFAIFGFLWGIIELGFMLLSAGRKRSLVEVYIIRAVKYFFLVDVTFLFCLTGIDAQMIVLNQVVFAGIILLMYFTGKLQQNQNKSILMSFGSPGFQRPQPLFDLRAELIVIALSLAFFALFWFFPDLAVNPISSWFHESIIDIEDTPVFGFIFKIIGFFFLVNILFKMLNGITFLLSGAAFRKPTHRNNKQQRDDDQFDDFEEIN